jgi:UDP-2-acetamido-3-amino-2,3-dideoxy-glucuronate N-acetyltransferase
MSTFIHPQALCESENIGDETRIWAFSHVLPGARIGKNCNICDYVFIENDVTVGDNVTIKSGVQLWEGVTLEDNVFVGPNVTFTNDKFPRSKIYPESFARTVVKKNASIGANATILPGITIHENAMVGAGSVVVKSVPPHAIVAGNPAKIISYTNTLKNNNNNSSSKNSFIEKNTEVKGVTLHTFPLITDLRGSLSVGEFPKQIPFIPKRYFLVFDVESSEVRGEHAHKHCHQFLICVKGSCAVIADDGKNREEFRLNAPNIGLYLPSLIWGIQYRYTSDAVLLVFASELYDADDYIRDYQIFLKIVS